MEDPLTREEVYNLIIISNEKFMDSPTPFMPENQFYRVASIKEGIYIYILRNNTTIMLYDCYLMTIIGAATVLRVFDDKFILTGRDGE